MPIVQEGQKLGGKSGKSLRCLALPLSVGDFGWFVRYLVCWMPPRFFIYQKIRKQDRGRPGIHCRMGGKRPGGTSLNRYFFLNRLTGSGRLFSSKDQNDTRGIRLVEKIPFTIYSGYSFCGICVSIASAVDTVFAIQAYRTLPASRFVLIEDEVSLGLETKNSPNLEGPAFWKSNDPVVIIKRAGLFSWPIFKMNGSRLLFTRSLTQCYPFAPIGAIANGPLTSIWAWTRNKKTLRKSRGCHSSRFRRFPTSPQLVREAEKPATAT